MTHYSLDIFSMWAFFLICGLLFYPKATILFRNWSTGGYVLSKIGGWVSVGYVLWLFASFHIIPKNMLTILLAMLIVYLLPPASPLASIFPLKNNGVRAGNIVTLVRKNWKGMLLDEVLFSLLFIGFLLIRMYKPDIFGAEKMMDYAFLQSNVKAVFFPPPDPWFAGGSINYYYFGYYLCSLPLTLFSIAPEIGYNLAIALLGALTFTIAYSISRQLCGGSHWWGLLGGLTVAVMGNFDGLLQLLSGKSFGALDIWKSSRIIEDTINEFPFFSFLWADLHGHVMALPVVLFFIALLIAFYNRAGVTDGDEKHPLPEELFPLLTIVVVLGILLMSNIWDFPIYTVVLGLFLWYLPPAAMRRITSFLPGKMGEKKWNENVLLVGLIAILVIGGLLSASLFLASYDGEQQGIRAVKDRSSVVEFMIHYGFFIFIAGLYLFSTYLPNGLVPVQNSKTATKYLFFGLFFLVVSQVLLHSIVVFLLIFYLFLFYLILNNTHDSEQKTIAILALAGFGLLLTCEFIYVKDFYGGQPRMNTVFKLGYQAWILLAIISPALIRATFHSSLLQSNRRFFQVFATITVMLIISVLIFPVSGTYSYSNHFRNTPTLNGTGHITKYHRDDALAIEWLKKQKDMLVLLEAPGDSYQYHTVYATFGGHISVLGWQQHESLWRDWTWKKIRKRVDQINSMYRSTDRAELLTMLRTYNVDLIMFGSHEMKEYGQQSLQQLKKFFPGFNTFGTVYVFDVRNEGAPR